MTPHVRPLVGLWFGWSVIIFQKGGHLHFYAPIVGALVQVLKPGVLGHEWDEDIDNGFRWNTMTWRFVSMLQV